ncbi:MAG: hypothetical protein LBD41_01325, partial [Clostridiales Family XIII bacterium]|nr:hypothetical protein [Clostridiales Family XIII bacterium]
MRNKVNAIQTGTILLALAFLSRFIGFLREILFANYYGIDPVMDAFVLANNIPAILLAWIFSGIVTAYTPLLSKEDEKGAEYGLLFTRKTINILLIISVITSLIGIFFSKPLIYIFAHGWFTGEVQTETIFYANIFVKIAFASTLFTAFPGIWAAYLRYKKVFILPNILTEILPKITAIAFVFISLYIGAAWIIAGTISGYILATFVLFFFLRKKFKYKPNKVIEDDAKKDSIIKKIMLLSIPVFIGSAIQQINSFVDTELATWLPSGSPAALNYGNLMASIGAALFSTGILTMIYPKLAEAYAKKDK